MSRKFIYQLGVLLGSSGKSSRSHTGRAPRQSEAQKRSKGALFRLEEIERRKAYKELKELKKAIMSDEGLMEACRFEAVKRGYKIYQEKHETIFTMIHDFFFLAGNDRWQENRRLWKAMEKDDSLKDICIKEAVKRKSL